MTPDAIKAIQAMVKERLHNASMGKIADLMGVSPATAYRYRSDPLEMPVSKFLAIVEELRIPVALGVMMSRRSFLEAERHRLRLEQAIGVGNGAKGMRLATTLHFTVNCEVADFTKFLFDKEYDEKSDDEREEYLSLRKSRCDLYLKGAYTSREIIFGEAYIDFFLRRNRFEGLSADVWQRQYDAIVETNDMPNVNRYIYTHATPELPVAICYSTRQAIVRADDITFELQDPEYTEIEQVMKTFVGKCQLQQKDAVRRFLLNPLKVGG